MYLTESTQGKACPLELTISQHVVLQRGPIITVVECHDVSNYFYCHIRVHTDFL